MYYKSSFHRFLFFVCIYSLAVIFIIATTEQIKQLSAARKPHPLHVHLPFTPCDHTPSDSNLIAVHTVPNQTAFRNLKFHSLITSAVHEAPTNCHRCSSAVLLATANHHISQAGSYLLSPSIRWLESSRALSSVSLQGIICRTVTTYIRISTHTIDFVRSFAHTHIHQKTSALANRFTVHTQRKSQWWYLYPALAHA